MLRKTLLQPDNKITLQYSTAMTAVLLNRIGQIQHKSKHNIVHLFVDRSLTCLYHNAKQHDTVEVIRFRGIELKEERQGLQRVFCPFHDDAEL